MTVSRSVRLELLVTVLVCAVLIAGCSAPGGSPVTREIAPDEMLDTEITGSERGVQVAAEAAQRFSAQLDLSVTAAELRVFAVNPATDGVLVTPDYFGVTGVTLSSPGDEGVVQVGVATPVQPFTATSGENMVNRHWDLCQTSASRPTGFPTSY